MPALPVDVILEIFCQLPVKSLLRFRCVSKQLLSIIDGKDFIKQHHQNRSLDQRLILEYYNPRDNRTNLFSLDLGSVDNDAIKLEVPLENWGFEFSVIGSCNGLLALSDRHSLSVCLWNVSTKKHRILPEFGSGIDNNHHFDDGFGYDVATDDYKLVRFVQPCDRDFEVVVYSLKANSWRRIEEIQPYAFCLIHDIGVFVSGALNWLMAVWEKNEHRMLISSFDMKSERFSEVSLPDCAAQDPDGSAIGKHVVVLKGCLCLCCNDIYQDRCDIWEMKEYGVKESWIKLYSLAGLGPSFSLPHSIVGMAFSKCGDKVLFYQCNGEAILHDLEDEKVEKDEIFVINGWPKCVSRANLYVDSLVSPNINTLLGE